MILERQKIISYKHPTPPPPHTARPLSCSSYHAPCQLPPHSRHPCSPFLWPASQSQTAGPPSIGTSAERCARGEFIYPFPTTITTLWLLDRYRVPCHAGYSWPKDNSDAVNLVIAFDFTAIQTIISGIFCVIQGTTTENHSQLTRSVSLSQKSFVMVSQHIRAELTPLTPQ